MSRLAFRSPETSPVTIDPTPITHNHYIIMEVTVKPVGNAKSVDVQHQASALREIRSTGKDLFEMNETRKVQSSGTTMYQTTETYGTAVSVEKIIEQLDNAGLTLRVNFNRPGLHSNTTCMELNSSTLARLIQTTADANGNKIAELRVKAEQATGVPSHGAMYVAVSNRGTQHFFSHIDYKITASYDAMYHESN